MGSYEAVKVRLDPTPKQERLMASHAGAARFAYNAGLAHVKGGARKQRACRLVALCSTPLVERE